MLNGLTNEGQVTDVLNATKDQDAKKLMIDYAKEQDT